MKLLTSAVVLLACLATPGMGMGMPKEIEEMMDYFNLFATCFGQGAMAEYQLAIQNATGSCLSVTAPLELLEAVQQLNEVELSDVEEILKNNPSLAQLMTGRKKRQAGKNEDAMTALTDNIASQKERMLTKLSNLTCVLAQMEILTPTAEINIDGLSFENMKEHLKGYGAAGDDEEFVRALTNSYSDCYDISESWPQKNLDRHPLMQAFGRQHIFLNCMHKMEEKLCYKYQAYIGLKMFHGLDTADNNLELPGDKFDVASAALKVLLEDATPEEKFLNKFFWTRSDM